MKLNPKSTALPFGSGNPSIFRLWESNKNAPFLPYINETLKPPQVKIARDEKCLGLPF